MLVELGEERFSFTRAERIDKDRGIAFGVKILGTRSKNGNDYTSSAIESVVKTYEGIGVFANHPEKKNQPRNVEDRLGRFKNIRRGSDGAYGDFHYLKSHPLASRVEEAIERSSEGMDDLFGFSHNAQGRGKKENGRFVVEEVVNPRSVDLVSEPATTRGLFEGVHVDPLFEQKGMAGDNTGGAARSALKKLTDAGMSFADISKALGTGGTGRSPGVLSAIANGEIKNPPADLIAALRRIKPPKDTEEGMKIGDLTLEMIKRERADLVEAIIADQADKTETDRLKSQVKSLTEEVDRFKAAEAMAQKAEKVEEAIKEANLPDAVVTEVFKSQLLEAKDDEAIKALIEDRAALAKVAKGKRPVSVAQDGSEGPQAIPTRTLREAVGG